MKYSLHSSNYIWVIWKIFVINFDILTYWPTFLILKIWPPNLTKTYGRSLRSFLMTFDNLTYWPIFLKFEDIFTRLSQKVEKVISDDFWTFYLLTFFLNIQDRATKLAQVLGQGSPNISIDLWPLDLLTYFLNFLCKLTLLDRNVQQFNLKMAGDFVFVICPNYLIYKFSPGFGMSLSDSSAIWFSSYFSNSQILYFLQ
jgi:hypothetical protein